jgi:peptidoglycan hydrolase-like protein with peptidoglycan-binding domain
LTALGLRIYTGARGSQFVCDDDGGFGDTVAAISKRADAPITSCAREKAAEPFLRQLGKMSQQELFDCAQAKIKTGRCPDSCHGNCNPANPPGRSTHERFNDGVAYVVWPAMFKLPVWGRGIDVQIDRVQAFCAEARREGFTVTATYPGSPKEAQHVNFRKQPKISLWDVRPLREGSRGPRVSLVVRLLWQAVDPQTGKPYLDPHVKPKGKFNPQVTSAVKAFQRDHHQLDDGVVGIHTIRALRAAARQAKKGKQ